MSNPVQDLFTEKFRPKNLKNLIVPSRIKDELKRGVIQNMLYFGNPGTGKSSTLFIMSQDHPYLYINASEEGKIDTIRERISKFCATTSLIEGKEKIKCVLLDEVDGASDEFYQALRGVMEKYAQNVRFLATANYIERVPDAMHSRFQMVSFDPLNDEEEKEIFQQYKQRVIAILNAAKISYTDESVSTLINKDFPDMRKTMNKLQSIYLRGVKEMNSDTIVDVQNFEELFQQCLKKPDKPYENYKQLVSQYANRVDEALISLGQNFPEYLREKDPSMESKIPMILIAVAEYQYQKAFTIDKMVTLLACVYKIQNLLNS